MKKDYNFSPRLFWRIKQSKNQAKNQTNQQISSFLIGLFCICSVTLLDAQGRFISKIAEGRYAAGTHNVAFNRQGLSSGTYFYQLRFNGIGVTKKMIVI